MHHLWNLCGIEYMYNTCDNGPMANEQFSLFCKSLSGIAESRRELRLNMFLIFVGSPLMTVTQTGLLRMASLATVTGAAKGLTS